MPDGKFGFLDENGYYKLYDNPMDAFANAEPRLLGTVILPMSKFKDQYIEIRRGLYTGKVEEGKGISRLIKEGETAAYETLGLKDVQLTGNFNGGPAVQLKTPYTPYPGATPVTSMLITGLNGPVNGWNFGNIGGTYLRKYLDPDLENNSGGKSTQHWIDIRYAEVLLNRAEAAYELTQLGKTTSEDGDSYRDEAFRCINLIRERAAPICWHRPPISIRSISYAANAARSWPSRTRPIGTSAAGASSTTSRIPRAIVS